MAVNHVGLAAIDGAHRVGGRDVVAVFGVVLVGAHLVVELPRDNLRLSHTVGHLVVGAGDLLEERLPESRVNIVHRAAVRKERIHGLWLRFDSRKHENHACNNKQSFHIVKVFVIYSTLRKNRQTPRSRLFGNNAGRFAKSKRIHCHFSLAFYFLIY